MLSGVLAETVGGGGLVSEYAIGQWTAFPMRWLERRGKITYLPERTFPKKTSSTWFEATPARSTAAVWQSVSDVSLLVLIVGTSELSLGDRYL